ncbi:hypothetical protein [Planctopirus limnophila]|uniref:hypothetical protein n=1 Tax=Planctopirus limnophila TaxID=120 RepID=UPI0001A2F710|nr:hypothetical protein [Planctopirus limnophila]
MSTNCQKGNDLGNDSAFLISQNAVDMLKNQYAGDGTILQAVISLAKSFVTRRKISQFKDNKSQ